MKIPGKGPGHSAWAMIRVVILAAAILTPVPAAALVISARVVDSSRFLSFRWKILGALLALLFTVRGASLVIVDDRSQLSEVEAGLRRELEVTRGTYEALLQRSERQMAPTTEPTAGNFGFQRAVAVTRDPATIESAALSVKDQIGVDAVWVTDESGLLYADTSGNLEPGSSLAAVPMIASTHDDEPASTIQLFGGSLW